MQIVGMKLTLCLVLFAGMACQSAFATMPPNPERLLEVKTCAEAKANLIKAQKGSPLLSAAGNAKIVSKLQSSVKRLCPK
jgi:hypothetical protein